MSDRPEAQISQPFETNYEGLFGKLCKYVPLFDVQSPSGWKVAYRSYDLTAWHNPLMQATLICEKSSDGWNVFIKDHNTGKRHRTLPKNTNRWKAFEAARAFFNGEPLIKAEGSGLIKSEELEDE